MLPAGGSTTVWLAVAGSDQGLPTAKSELTKALASIETDRYRTEGALTLPSEGPRPRHRHQG